MHIAYFQIVHCLLNTRLIVPTYNMYLGRTIVEFLKIIN